jgi:citrate synthase
MPEIHKGLEEVYIDTSEIGRVFGQEGKLSYRGYWIQDLAEKAQYEEVVHLLINGELPDTTELQEIRSKLAQNRSLSDTTKQLIRNMQDTSPMDVLRTAVSSLSEDVRPEEFNTERNKQRGLEIIAKAPTIVAHLNRVRNGDNPLDPDPDLSHAANFLYMLHGEKPTEAEEEAMDTALILYAEHGMNASTFAAVTSASTLANMYSCICSGIGTLQGPLHGGATETVVDMLDEIGSKDNVHTWEQHKLEAHEKIPGFGHRVYKALDPRCAQFERVYKQLSEEREDTERLELIKALHKEVVNDL